MGRQRRQKEKGAPRRESKQGLQRALPTSFIALAVVVLILALVFRHVAWAPEQMTEEDDALPTVSSTQSTESNPAHSWLMDGSPISIRELDIMSQSVPAEVKKIFEKALKKKQYVNQQVGALGIGWNNLPRKLQRDMDTVVELWKKSANKGHPVALFCLGFVYEQGHGVPQSFPEAWMWLERAAEAGYPESQFILASYYKFGRPVGTGVDDKKARMWYEKAAKQGHARAQYDLGVIYHDGHGIPRDYTVARKWWELAAAKGDIDAQYNLGLLCALGRGGPQDFTRAVESWELASQGSSKAQYNLGMMYREGIGGAQNFKRAFELMSLAAATPGDGPTRGSAMQNMAAFYANGQGVEQDLEEAMRWLNKASKQGMDVIYAKELLTEAIRRQKSPSYTLPEIILPGIMQPRYDQYARDSWHEEDGFRDPKFGK